MILVGGNKLVIFLIQCVPNLIQVFPEEPVTLVLLRGGVFGHWIQVRRLRLQE